MDAAKLSRIVREIQFPDGHRVVLLDAPTDGTWSMEECRANVYRLDASGRVVWQVQAPMPRLDTDSFVSIGLNEGKLEASRFFGAEFEIDAETGAAEEVGWHK